MIFNLYSYYEFIYLAEANPPPNNENNTPDALIDTIEIYDCVNCNELLTTNRAFIYNPSINPEQRNPRVVTIYRCTNIFCSSFCSMARRMDSDEVISVDPDTGERTSVPVIILQMRSHEDEATGNFNTHDYLPPIEE